MHAAGPVADGDDLAPFLLQQLRADGADVAEALHRHRGVLHLHAEVRERLLGDDHAAASRRFPAAERAAHLDRLPGHDRRDGMSHAHRIGVHDPRHDTLVRVDIRRGHVGIGTQRRDDRRGVAAREPLELANTHLQRITHHAALRATERDVDDGALPRHPGRQRRDLVERDVEVEADATLCRTARRVVEHADAGVDLHLTVVEHHRNRRGDLLLGVPEHLVDAGLEVEQFCRAVEARHHRFEWVLFREKSVLVRADNRVGGEQKIRGHSVRSLGRRGPA